MNAKRGLLNQLIAILVMLWMSVASFASDDFPGDKPDRKTIETQQKVDELFEKGDLERAYFIYRHELAPKGDKFAQYMVGYMNIAGKGVDRDIITGSAWYRLAAERGNNNLRQASDELWQHLDEEKRALSDKRYAELRVLYSDAMIVTKLVEKDLDFLSGQVTESALAYSAEESAQLTDAERNRLQQEARTRVVKRLRFLQNTIASGRPMAGEEIPRIRQLEQRAASILQ